VTAMKTKSFLTLIIILLILPLYTAKSITISVSNLGIGNKICQGASSTITVTGYQVQPIFEIFEPSGNANPLFDDHYDLRTSGNSFVYTFYSSGYYEIRVRSYDGNGNMGSDITYIGVFVFSAATPTSIVSASRCGAGGVTLSAATGTGGDAVKWYDQNGSYLSTGNTYSPNVTSTKTYYYAKTYYNNGGCLSSPATVVATVNPIPSPPTAINALVCTTGDYQLSGTPASGANTLRWYNSSSEGTPIKEGPTYTSGIYSTTTYYISSYNSSTTCESSSRTSITATLGSAAKSGTLTTNNAANGNKVCLGGSLNISVSENQITPIYQSTPIYKIIDGSGQVLEDWEDGKALGTSFSYIFNVPGIWQISTRAFTDGCRGDEISTINVNVISPAAPVSITPGSRCDAGQVSLSASPGTAGDAVKWYDQNSTYLSTGNTYSPNISSTTTYNIKTYYSSANCESQSASIKGTINDSPAIKVVTASGSEPYCSATGISIGLKGSERTASYQLYNGSSPDGSIVYGTGNDLDFGNHTVAGNYTVKATSLGCPKDMSGNISLNPSPSIFSLAPTGAAPYCSGTGTAISLNLGESGVSYQLYNGSSTIGTAKTGTGSTIDFGTQTAVGTYTIKATNSTTGCNRSATNSVVINASPTPIITGESVSSVGNTTNFTTESNMSGYTWVATGGNVASGAGTKQATVKWVSNGNKTITVNYTNTAGCKASSPTTKSVTIYPLPIITQQPISIYKRTGNSATFSVSATGTSLTYQWRKNTINIANATAASYTISNIQTSDAATYDVKITGAGNGIVTSNQVKLDITFQGATDKNYTITRTILQDNVTDESTVPSLPVEGMEETVNYYDGLGRPIQQVTWEGSPSKLDVIQPVVYDAFGREERKYLPYADTTSGNGAYKDGALAYHAKFYKKMGFSQNDSTYARTIFEASPLSRVLQQGAPGLAWQPSTGHAQALDYQTNTATEVKQWNVNSSNQCVLHSSNSGYYDANQLYINQITDENGSISKEYKDKEGHVVLKTGNDGTNTLNTYYVYDDFGLLRYVIPPKASAAITVSTLSQTDDVVKKLCYYYQYDSRNRMIVKQLPGVDPVYMVYDSRDRLVLTQDGRQRVPKNWTFTKYDCFNRPIITGLINISDVTTQADVQAKVNQYYVDHPADANRYEVTDNSTLGYTLTSSFPSSVAETNLLTITFYDTYPSFALSAPLSFSPSSTLGITANNSAVKGQVTGGKVKNLANNGWLKSTVYYDNKYRVIQTTKENHLGGIDRVTNLLDFVGKSIKCSTEHTGTSAVSTLRTFEYDHAGRLTKIWHSVNGGTPILMSYMTYNELGQLVDKKIHSTDASHVNYLQSIDYRYNIRGWLKSINNADLGTSPTSDDSSHEKSDAFGMELRYELPF
jgi:hypothetical protein